MLLERTINTLQSLLFAVLTNEQLIVVDGCTGIAPRVDPTPGLRRDRNSTPKNVPGLRRKRDWYNMYA